MPARSKLSKYAESNDQITAMDWLKLQYPLVALHTMHIGNERKSTPRTGYIMKRMGTLKGASDLFIAWPTNQYHGLFIEIKSLTGRPTKEQLDFLKRMSSVGYMAKICYGYSEVIETIATYLKS